MHFSQNHADTGTASEGRYIGAGRDKSAPTDVLLQPLDFWLNRLFEMYCPLRVP